MGSPLAQYRAWQRGDDTRWVCTKCGKPCEVAEEIKGDIVDTKDQYERMRTVLEADKKKRRKWSDWELESKIYEVMSEWWEGKK